MKALCYFRHGEGDVTQVAEVPAPSPATGEVLVRVRACALNHLDIWVRRGWPGLDLPMPHWGGTDVAGEVAALGPGVSGWSPGERVVAFPGVVSGEDEYTRRGEPSMSPLHRILGEDMRGGAAEFVCIPAANLLRVPAHVELATAAASVVTGVTAWRMLIHRARLRPAETVLVVGAGGGVNTMAVQIARIAGARVIAVASDTAKARRVLDLGADTVIDRSATPDWAKEAWRETGRRGAQVVVDNVGAATLPASMRAAARGGRIVIVGNTSGFRAEIDTRLVFGKQLSLIGSTLGNLEDFREVMEGVFAGRLAPVIDSVVPLAEGVSALSRLERGEFFGKIVLAP